MSLNVFGCPLSSLQYHAEDIVDRYSAEQKHQSCGIWTVASHINHGCFTNVFRSFIGDMMIIRATRDLAPGTELLFQYITGEPKDLKKRLREHWGFTCDCPMCADERQTSGTTLTKRRKLCDSIDAKFEASTSNHRSVPKEQVVQLLSQVAAAYTRPPNEVPRPSLAHRQIRLAVAYGNEGIHRACIKWVRNGLTSLGFVLTGTDSASSPFSITTWGIVNPYLLEPFMAAREAFINLGEKENFGRADYYAKLVSRIVLGEDDSIGIT